MNNISGVAAQGVSFLPIKDPWPGHDRGFAKCRETTSTALPNWTDLEARKYCIMQEFIGGMYGSLQNITDT